MNRFKYGTTLLNLILNLIIRYIWIKFNINSFIVIKLLY